MAMHAAKLENSPRLQRVLSFLRRSRKPTTRDIIRECDVCAVNSIIAELNAPINGFNIVCTPVAGQRGVYQYELDENPQMSLFGRM
jgi:hypothetical protein